MNDVSNNAYVLLIPYQNFVIMHEYASNRL